MEKILVTGGSGYIGSQVGGFLLQRNYSVRVLTRKDIQSRMPNLSVIKGDLLNEQDVRRAMRDCRYVIHCAAKVSYNEKDKDEILKTNTEGTQLLVKVAEDLEVDNLVFVSSAITRGYSSGPDVRDEKCVLDNPEKCTYAYSKLFGEKIVTESKLKNWVIVYPSLVRQDSHIERILYSSIIPCPPGGNNVVDLDDVCFGIIAAMGYTQKDSFLLTGHNKTYQEIYSLIRKVAQQLPFILRLPKWTKCLAKWKAGFSPDDFFTPEVVEQSYGYKYYTNEKAERLLKWKPKFDYQDTIIRGYVRYGKMHPGSSEHLVKK